jgi:long-chain acyl-CoA synthetase
MSKTVLEHLREHSRRRPDAVAYGEKVAGEWRTTTWREYDREVRACARALLAQGIEPQQTVAILGGNRPEWSVLCLAAMSIRAIAVGVYQTCSPEQVAYIVDHAEAPLILVEDGAQLAKVEAERERMPLLRTVVLMRDLAGARQAAAGTLAWEDFLARGETVPEEAAEARFAAIEGDDIASFIYTSGTTGHPKAVMISHQNILDTGRIGNALHGIEEGDTMVSYLPLAHVAEQMMSIHMPASIGFAIYYAESTDKLPQNLLEVQPSIFFAVPRVWERYFAAITDRLKSRRALARRVAAWAMRSGFEFSEALNHGERPSPLLRLRFALADRLVLAKVRAAIGLRNLRIAASGAAPITKEILDFFAGLGVRVYEVYGLSETCGPGTWNRAGRTRLGTVGPPLPEVELRLEEDGEVLFRGPNVFRGYFKDEKTTAETLDSEGWLHTGDLGRLDDNGCLTITGRKKEILITSGGKNVAPVPIENALKELELVGDAVVIGDGRRFLTALIALEEEAAGRFARRHGLPGERQLHLEPGIVEELRRGIERVNQRFARVETVRDFRLLPLRLSPDRGELTPTLKLKRRAVADRYAELIEEMYG